jgi:hypothetical protein
VLRQGVKPSDYAECLLALKEDSHSLASRIIAPAANGLSMAGRIRALLAPGRPHTAAWRFGSALATAAVAVALLTIGSARLAPTMTQTLRLVEDWRWERRGYAVRVLTRTMLLSRADARGLRALSAMARHDQHPRVRDRARNALTVLAEAGARTPNRIRELPP